mgnify:CR=1 FL=1
MQKIEWKVDKVHDSHVHYRSREPLEHFVSLLDQASVDKANILGGRDASCVDRKRAYPGRLYVFGMLTHEAEKVEAGDGEYLVGQVDTIMGWGCDGLKMMAGKPQRRREWMPLDIDHDYFTPLWTKCEADQVPITIHQADPINWWDKDREKSYHDLPPQEHFHQQAINVMERHPNLRMNFAHFLYLSPQLDRLGDLFGRFPQMRVDLALGDEWLYYCSDDPDKSREFFITWADRIMYGTDTSDHNSPELAWAKAENIRRMFETDQTFHNLRHVVMGREPVPESNGRVELVGMDLPLEVEAKVMATNFEEFAGAEPRPVPEG